jgi:hypothetical protein
LQPLPAFAIVAGGAIFFEVWVVSLLACLFHHQTSVKQSSLLLDSFPPLEVEIEVKLQSTVSRLVYLGIGFPSGAHDRFFF